jgi:SSS family solute:Na+ symporter
MPLTLGYAFMGLAVGAVFVTNPEVLVRIPEGNPDYMVPTFVLTYMPHGIKALIFAAILAAAMSSLDSALNSLSAATMRDFIERYIDPGKPRQHLILGKLITVAWGVMIIVFAFLLGGEETVVERINKVGSAFYGPILAAFVVGVSLRRVQGSAIVTGVLAGVGINLLLWLGKGNVFWMWWNFTGCVMAMLVAVGISFIKPKEVSDSDFDPLVLWDTDVWKEERRWIPVYGCLFLFFIGLFALCACLPGILTSN